MQDTNQPVPSEPVQPTAPDLSAWPPAAQEAVQLLADAFRRYYSAGKPSPLGSDVKKP